MHSNKMPAPERCSINVHSLRRKRWASKQQQDMIRGDVLVTHYIFVCSIFKLFIYLFSFRLKHRLFHLFPQRPTIARAGPNQNQEPGTQSRSPTWGWQGTKDLSHHCCLAECAPAGSEWGTGELGLSPSPPMWDVGVSDSDLTAPPCACPLCALF